METNERNPAKWSDAFWRSAMGIIKAYVRKWSGDDAPAPLNSEAREEIASRIYFDILTGEELPEGMTPMHHIFRVCRRWRIKAWAGDCELDRERKRSAARRYRDALANPGSEASEQKRNKSPYRGCSDDARQPNPLAVLMAIETATLDGLRYVSARQAKRRRRAVKGRRVIRRYCRPTGLTRPAVLLPSGRLTYWPGTATRLEWHSEVVAECGPFGRPHVSHVGTIPNRAIGKKATARLGSDAIGQAMARMAIVGREETRRFVPAQTPTRGIPAQSGDGTEWRAIRQ